MATGEVVGFTGDGGDPRINNPMRAGDDPIPPSNRLLHDPAVPFEEYRYYAELTRAEEEETFKTDPPTTGIMQVLFPTKSSGGVKPISTSPRSPGSPGSGSDEKGLSEKNFREPREKIAVSEAEWTNASRAIRTASGAACFYLITTDILGPFGIG
jgi:hypothetical protein